jgi:hypothetical protein
MRYLLTLSLVISVAISAPARAGFPDLFYEPGVMMAPNGSCEASIAQSPTGRFKVLVITRLRDRGRAQAVEAKDVTGAVWIANDKLVYSIGPRHGTPGVFFFDCATGTGKRLVGATTRNKAYPQGADYFELDDFSRGSYIWYYHVPDVTPMDTPAFRKLDFLRRMVLTEPYEAHIAKAYPGARLLARSDFQSWILRDFKQGHPGLRTGRFNDDELEDFAAMIRPDSTGGIRYEAVVCHALPQGGYDGCQQLGKGGNARAGTVRFYLTAYGPRKVVCLEPVVGRYGADLVEKPIELKTYAIGYETDVAAGLYMYQPDGSYAECTTAD